MCNRSANLVAAFLLAAHAALLAWAATKHSPSIDEVGHMAAGVCHWRFGRFDLYRVNPPLVRLVATAPVVLMRPRMDWAGYPPAPGTRLEFDCGQRFIQANGERSFWLFTVARWAWIPFSLLGGYVCYRWATELYGATGGLLALVLWCFGPNVLAHAQMITPDVGAAALGSAACYSYWRWLRGPTWGAALATGIALGITELTKATFLVLYAILPLTWLFWRGTSVSATNCAGKPNPRNTLQLALMAALSVYVLNVGYAFEGSLQPLSEFNFTSESLAGPRDMAHRHSNRRNRFAETPLDQLRVPLPANYLLGIDQQKSDFERGYDSYLRGEWRHGGWWYYYLYGLAIKAPLGTWLLLLLAVAMGIVEFGKQKGWQAESRAARPHPAGEEDGSPRPSSRLLEGDQDSRPKACPLLKGEAVTWRDEVVLMLPAMAIVALVSSQTGFNHHLRYVLPVFPFVFVFIGRLGPHLDLGVRRFITAFRRCGGAVPRQKRTPASNTTGETDMAECEDGSAINESSDESRRSSVVAAVSAMALAWSIGSSLWYYPHSLSYFNELVGGPLAGRWHLLDSNIDWGQDLLYLKKWLDKHPKARPLGLAYFGYFDPRAAGIEFRLPPHGPVTSESEEMVAPDTTRTAAADEFGPRPGWYAVSVVLLHGYKYPIPNGKGGRFYTDLPYFAYFQRFEPVARAGYSIYIYHLLPADVDRVRRELGLPPLSQPTNAVKQ